MDKDGLSELSSDTLSGIKRLIDEIRSFKCVCVSLGSLFVLHLSGKTMDSSVLISQQSTQDFRMLLQDVRLQALHRADGLPEKEGKSTGKHGFQKNVDAYR